MKKVFCVLTLLAIVAVVSAEVDVRIWLTTQNPNLATTGIGNPMFLPGYGPFTPYTTGSNLGGTYDIHRTGYVSPPPQAGSVNGDGAGFPPPPFLIDPTKLTVEEPGNGVTTLLPGTPVYIWATFAGPGSGYPPLMGTAPSGTKIQGMHLTLVTHSPDPLNPLVLAPQWYQVQDIGGALRWEITSDMTGNTVTLVGVASAGWQNANLGTNDLLQAPLTVGRTTGGAILLGAINATGRGDVSVGLGYNGMNSNVKDPPDGPGGNVVYFPGTELVGIPAGVLPEGSAPRVGATPEATWVPEPASLLLIGLGGLLLRRR